MPADIDKSAEQDEIEEEMTDEEVDAFFAEGESDEDSDDSDEGDDKPADDDSGDEEEDSEDDDAGNDESDEEESDDDEDGDEEEEDDDPLAEVKAQAAALKEQDQADTDKATADAARAEKATADKADILKELFGQDKVKIGDKEVDLKALSEEYGEDLDTLITARAMQIAEPLVQKAMEAGGFATQEAIQAIQTENAEFRLMSEVAQTHPEIFKLKNDNKFWSWVDAGGDDVAALMNKGDAKSISTVVGAYKKASIKKTNANLDKQAGEKKKKHTDLHGTTLRSKGGKKGSKKKKNDGPMSDSEAEAAFAEAEVTD